MSIYLNDQGRLTMSDDYDPVLAQHLFLDVEDDLYKCLVSLHRVARIAQGLSQREVYVGDTVSVLLTPEYADLTNNFDSSSRSRIPFEAFRSAVEELWSVACRRSGAPGSGREDGSGSSAVERELVNWERTFQQRHLYRGRIAGIPAA